MRPGESYYEILNVRPDAQPDEITAAYRRLAKILHPDVCESQDAEELFKVVNEAYQVLKDPKKRAEYDTSLLRSDESPMGDFYTGAKRYRHPRTWYYTHTTQSGFRERPPEPERPRAKRSTIPHLFQVILFYCTLLMAIVILAQLFLLPWIAGTNAAEAREAFYEGSRYVDEGEYLLAIERFTIATGKNPGFSLAWKEKGIAEMKKADELMQLGRDVDAKSFYRDALRSFSGMAPEDAVSEEVLTATARAYIALGQQEDAKRVIALIRKTHPDSASLPGLLLESDRVGPSSPAT